MLAVVFALVLSLASATAVASTADHETSDRGKGKQPPEYAPRQPVPGEDVSLWGYLGKKGDKIKLQSKAGKDWATLQKTKAGKRGTYVFHIRSGAAPTTFRIASGKGRHERSSKPVHLKPITGQQLTAWDDLCRGSLSDEAAVACLLRDDAIMTLGVVAARDFHEAWQARDAVRMRALATSDSVVQAALGWTLTADVADCRYTATDPSWYCFVKGSSGNWTGFNTEVTASGVNQLPTWRVTAAGAPDV